MAAITFEMGLRAAFPPAAELDPLWQRAARRGQLMGRLGARLSLGCTSGLALSGGALLQLGSFVFVGATFAAAFAVAPFVRRLWR